MPASLVEVTKTVVGDVVIWSPVVKASAVVASVFFGDTKALVDVTTVVLESAVLVPEIVLIVDFTVVVSDAVKLVEDFL